MPTAGRLRALAVAVTLALGVLLATRAVTPLRWYAEHGAYRAQVEAFLDGRLALSHAPESLAHDLAWTPSGVQQVWGLGVPLWQTPFELLGRALGVSPFPDRVALLAWLTLGIFAVLRGFRRRTPHLPWWRTAGVVLVTCLLPPIITVLRSRIGVYEEAALYAWIAAMILLGGLASLHHAPTPGRYLALVTFAGATGLIRPTVWFYGLATFLIATAILLRARRALPTAALGLALFVAGGGALYATNLRRFGAGGEFGHRLNLASLPGNLVATRFDYPFAHVGVITAAEELAASFVTYPERRSKKGFYQAGLHPGQAEVPRWREYYFSTFGWAYLPGLLAGILLALVARRREPASRLALDEAPSDAAAITQLLAAWAVLGAGPLVIFYLRSPSVSSRYQLDLGPAIVAFLVITWLALARRARPAIALVLLVGGWAGAVATAKIARPKVGSAPVDQATAADTTARITRPFTYDRALPASYDLDDPWLPLATDVALTFDRCADLDGRPVDCDAPPLDGDLHVHGDRTAGTWWADATTPVAPDRCEVETTCTLDAIRTAPALRVGGAAPPPALYLNGVGWDLTTGQLPPATFFYVQDAAFVELDVAALAPPLDRDWAALVRVNVGPHHLHLATTASTATGARLRFVPAEPLDPGLDLAFVAVGPIDELDRPLTDLAVRRLRWR